jgi:hypothetical protein
MQVTYSMLFENENVFKNKSFTIKENDKSWSGIFKGINHVGNNQVRIKEKIPNFGFKENDGSIVYIPEIAISYYKINMILDEENFNEYGYMELDLIHNLVNETTSRGFPKNSKGFKIPNKIKKIEYNFRCNKIRLIDIYNNEYVYEYFFNLYQNQPE